MSTFRNYSFVQNGNQLTFFEYTTMNGVLPPGKQLRGEFLALTGPIQIDVTSLDSLNPSEERIVATADTDSGITGTMPDLDGVDGAPTPPRDDTDLDRETVGTREIVTIYHHVRVKVEIISPAGNVVQTWHTRTDIHEIGSFFDWHIPEQGTWSCRVSNENAAGTAKVGLSVRRATGRSILQERNISMRLMNNTFAVVLEALMPSAQLDDDLLTVSLGSALRSHLGDDARGLGVQTVRLPDGVYAQGETKNVCLEITEGQELREVIRIMWEERDRFLRASPSPARDVFIRQNDNWRDEWNANVAPSDVVLHARVVASKVGAEYSTFLVDVNLLTIEDLFVDIYIGFNPWMTVSHVLVRSPARFTGGLADLAEDLDIIPEAGEWIEKELPGLIQRVGPLIGEYFGEVLVQLIQRDNIFLRAQITEGGGAIRVESCAQPTVPRPLPAFPEPLPAPIVPADLMPAGEFIVPDEASVDRLANIDTIVVLMMENRSFDHILGHLRQSAGEQYDGFTGRETNQGAPPYAESTYSMAPAFPTVTPFATQIMPDPQHKFAHVRDQVADGAMSGFVSDFLSKVPQPDPQLVMTYYTSRELPTYYSLASSYTVCDQWFASHAGPTMPNRFCTIMGTTPEVDNLSTSDPRLAFFRGTTIFDLLTDVGVDWRYFEGDVGFLRIFDQYRLDDSKVLPFDQPQDGFKAYLRNTAGSPRVIFIDPNFVDLPPISTGNDDHPPAELGRGQALVAEIYNELIQSADWQRTMFLITYDEHGGFYDHVAPPGTPAGAPELVNNIPRVHPEGATHYGVRVPALVVSPRVNSGSVSHQTFDHTSIIKTILLRFRNMIPQARLSQFGPRVNAAAHLGTLLNAEARTAIPEQLDVIRPRHPRFVGCEAPSVPRVVRPDPERRRNAPDLRNFPPDTRRILRDSRFERLEPLRTTEPATVAREDIARLRRQYRSLERSLRDAERNFLAINTGNFLAVSPPGQESDDFGEVMRVALLPRR